MTGHLRRHFTSVATEMLSFDSLARGTRHFRSNRSSTSGTQNTFRSLSLLGSPSVFCRSRPSLIIFSCQRFRLTRQHRIKASDRRYWLACLSERVHLVFRFAFGFCVAAVRSDFMSEWDSKVAGRQIPIYFLRRLMKVPSNKLPQATAVARFSALLRSTTQPGCALSSGR